MCTITINTRGKGIGNMRKRAKIDMTHRYYGADTHRNADSFKRRMRGYVVRVLAEKKAKEKAERVKK